MCELGFDRMSVTIGSTQSLLESRNANALDLAIAFNAHHGRGVRVISEVQCRVELVYCPARYLVAGPEISVTDCLDWRICLPGAELSLHPRLYAQILKQRKSRISSRPATRSSSSAMSSCTATPWDF